MNLSDPAFQLELAANIAVAGSILLAGRNNVHTWWLGIVGCALFMQMLDSTILNTSLPSIAKDLNESPLDMQNAIISYVLTLALFMPVSGFLADKFGTRKVFIFAIAIFSLGLTMLGAGLGPLAIGVLSDVLVPQFAN